MSQNLKLTLMNKTLLAFSCGLFSKQDRINQNYYRRLYFSFNAGIILFYLLCKGLFYQLNNHHTVRKYEVHSQIHV